MKNEFLQLADDARLVLSRFAMVEKVAAAFEKVGKLQQAGDEAQVRLDALTVKVGETAAQVQAAQADAQRATDEAENTIKRAKDEADEITQHAQDRAAEIISKASQTAADTRAQTEVLTAEANAEVQAAQVTRDARKAETDELQAKLDRLNAQAKKLLG